jgi:hypothetical protein
MHESTRPFLLEVLQRSRPREEIELAERDREPAALEVPSQRIGVETLPSTMHARTACSLNAFQRESLH